jgi:hypothetical protein
MDVIALVGSLANLTFWAAIAFGLVEMTAVVCFWRWAFGLGPRRVQDAGSADLLLPTHERSGTTRFAAFKVLKDGTCLFRRKSGVLQTALEWKGMLRSSNGQAEVMAFQPLGPTVAGAAFVVSWASFGVSLALQGKYVAGLILIAVVAVGAVSSLKSVQRTARIRFDRYRSEVISALKESADSPVVGILEGP